jgi:TolA-binding protein
LFQKSLVLERKAGAMAQMASALNALGRYDEALRWYETVLAEFPNASDKLRLKVNGEMKDLHGFIMVG